MILHLPLLYRCFYWTLSRVYGSWYNTANPCGTALTAGGITPLIEAEGHSICNTEKTMSRLKYQDATYK